MTHNFEQILARLPQQAQEHAAKRVEVDLTDLLGDGAIFAYREPTVYDLYAVADTRVLADWRRAYPDMPDTLIAQLELMARLHVAPPAEMPTGKLYAQLINTLTPAQAVVFMRRVERALSDAFGLGDLEEQVEQKKATTGKVKRR